MRDHVGVAFPNMLRRLDELWQLHLLLPCGMAGACSRNLFEHLVILVQPLRGRQALLSSTSFIFLQVTHARTIFNFACVNTYEFEISPHGTFTTSHEPHAVLQCTIV